MNHRFKQNLCTFLAVVLIAVQIVAPQSVSAETKQYVKEEIYFEDFNSVSSETLTSWDTIYNKDTAEKEQWYRSQYTTLALDAHTSEDDKALSMQAHIKGQNNYYYFKLPGDIQDDGIAKYEVTFDYYSYGDWCDWFHLRNSEGTDSSINMSYSLGWRTITMTMDLENSKWYIGNTECTHSNVSSVLNGDDLILAIRLHSNANNGAKIKIDNFRVYKYYENLNYDIYDEAISLYDKFDVLQDDMNNVDIKLGKINIDFGTEELESFSEDCITLDGDVSYEASFADNTLSILIASPRLEYNTTYTLTLDGLQTKSGKTVSTKEFSFKTLENVPIISDGAYIEYEDFEEWTNSTCSTHYNDSMITSGGFRTWTTTGIVSGKDGGNALTPMNKTSANRSLQYYFVPMLENDTFVIEYDYYPGDIENYGNIKFSIFRSKDGTGVTVIPKEGMTAFSGEWGHVRLEVKPANSTWNVVVTNAAGEVVYENQNGTWADSNIKMIDWDITVLDTTKLTNEENLPKIDNFVVNAFYSAGPKLTEKNISIYEGETLQDMSSVSPAANKIIVDFVQRMLPDDMNKDNIYITPSDEPFNPIDTIDRYASGKYEMSPVEYLIPGETYTIHIEVCRNVTGVEMTKSYTFDFIAGEGGVSIELTKLTQDGTDIVNLSNLSAGSAKLEVFYKNSTGNTYLLHYIIAFYNGHEMVHSVYSTDELANHAVGQISETNIIIPEISEEYDEVNIIAWDNFNGMRPVSKSLVLK